MIYSMSIELPGLCCSLGHVDLLTDTSVVPCTVPDAERALSNCVLCADHMNECICVIIQETTTVSYVALSWP